MILKFLEGYIRATSGDTPANAPFQQTDAEMGLVLSIKRDILQHSEMARYVKLNPWSGFVKRIDKLESTSFFGESISCSVKVRDSDEHYRLYLSEAKIWFAEVDHYRRKHSIFITLPENYKPWDPEGNMNWKQVSYSEMLSILEAENSEYYY